METKASYLGIELVVGSVKSADFTDGHFCGAIVQYPDTFGEVNDLSDFSKYCHDHGALVVAVTDILASSILKPVGEMGVDIAVGSAQRFGVPLVYFLILPFPS
jgi:glycine dehydrogenase